jgi:hypothetical protein
VHELQFILIMQTSVLHLSGFTVIAQKRPKQLDDEIDNNNN